jgi:protein-tyrosine phosphatase
MVIKLPAALFNDGRLVRVLNRLISGVVRSSPLRDVLARRARQRLPARARRALFVCKGNICRSAYAHAVAARIAPPQAGWSFFSAGLTATPGTASPETALRVARARGVDLSEHRSRTIQDFDPQEIDVVFVMEPVQVLHPALGLFRTRMPILTLGMVAGDPLIEDPYGRNEAAFHRCFAEIERAVDLYWGERDQI